MKNSSLFLYEYVYIYVFYIYTKNLFSSSSYSPIISVFILRVQKREYKLAQRRMNITQR